MAVLFFNTGNVNEPKKQRVFILNNCINTSARCEQEARLCPDIKHPISLTGSTSL
jgi:hypothetical protein